MPSAVIKSYTYNPVHKTLEVCFLSGKKYHYLNVPEEVYLKMKAAYSKGTFFNNEVRPFFECLKIEDNATGHSSQYAQFQKD